MLERVRIDRSFDGMPRRIDIVDRQFFGGACVGIGGDIRLGFFPGRLPRGALEPAAFAPALGLERRR
jgi:hypothetical protein